MVELSELVGESDANKDEKQVHKIPGESAKEVDKLNEHSFPHCVVAMIEHLRTKIDNDNSAVIQC